MTSKCYSCNETVISSISKYCKFHKCRIDTCVESYRNCTTHKCHFCSKQPIKYIQTNICVYCKCVEQECVLPSVFMNKCSMHVPRCICCDDYALLPTQKNLLCVKHGSIFNLLEQYYQVKIHYDIWYLLSKIHSLGNNRVNINSQDEDIVGILLSQVLNCSNDIFQELCTYMF